MLARSVQGRVDRHQKKLEDQLPTGKLQSERIAQGKKPMGRNPQTDVRAHQEQIERAE